MVFRKSHIACLILGLAIGAGGMLAVTVMQPDPLLASTTDRTSKFAMATVQAEALGLNEGVFVLDFINGTLVGGVINKQTGKYTHRYFRQISQDFGVDPNNPEPEYAIVGTTTDIQGNNAGKGILHVAEKSSGKMVAYGFLYPTRPTAAVMALQPLDVLQFRESSN